MLLKTVSTNVTQTCFQKRYLKLLPQTLLKLFLQTLLKIVSTNVIFEFLLVLQAVLKLGCNFLSTKILKAAQLKL